MKNDTSSIISRFHVSSMAMAVFMIVSIGTIGLYTLLAGHSPTNMSLWQYCIAGICIVWMLYSAKDWMAYYKLFKLNPKLIQDERFVQESGLAAKMGFGFLIFSNFGLLMIDLVVFKLNAPFVAVFSMVFGLVVHLSTLIYLELRA